MKIRVYLTSLLLLVVSSVQSAVVVPMTVEDLYASSKSVIHGEVVDQYSSAYKNQFYTISTISVADDFKGGKTASEIEVIEMGGAIGPLSGKAAGLATLAKGEEVIVFLSEKPADKANKSDQRFDPQSPFVNNPMIMGGLQGKFKIERSTTDEVIGNKRITTEKTAVLRPGNARLMKSEGAPSLDQFTQSLRTLEARMASKSNLKTKTIPTLGEVETISPQTDLVTLRRFDPDHLLMAEKYAKSLKAKEAKAGANAEKSASSEAAKAQAAPPVVAPVTKASGTVQLKKVEAQ